MMKIIPQALLKSFGGRLNADHAPLDLHGFCERSLGVWQLTMSKTLPCSGTKGRDVFNAGAAIHDVKKNKAGTLVLPGWIMPGLDRQIKMVRKIHRQDLKPPVV
ncbi:MAG: hypothetical protein HUK40_24215 [Desulfobacter sp.]|nr:hypothetical protein [Desulfobacter sp.]